MTGKNILVALDFPTLDEAFQLAYKLRDKTGFKVGMELNTAAGTPAVVNAIGKNVFLDLKFHDIPNTVEAAVAAAARHHVMMCNVHCLGGKPMLEAAARGARSKFPGELYRPLVIGVTILTSQDRAGLTQIGIDPNLSMEEIVTKLAILAYESGLDGVVSSPQEITAIRRAVQCNDFSIITPGIRGANSKPDDQKRTMTIREARDLGADYFVIGRPITKASDPLEAAEWFIEEITT